MLARDGGQVRVLVIELHGILLLGWSEYLLTRASSLSTFRQPFTYVTKFNRRQNSVCAGTTIPRSSDAQK